MEYRKGKAERNCTQMKCENAKWVAQTSCHHATGNLQHTYARAASV